MFQNGNETDSSDEEFSDMTVASTVHRVSHKDGRRVNQAW